MKGEVVEDEEKAIICLAIVMFLMGTMQTFAEENSTQNYSITTPYEFEVQPGDDEWKNLFTTEEMINACQIPESIMKKMTTSALIKTMLSNSFILDFQTCNDSLYAMEMLEKNFNVFRELQTRTDYMGELLSIYNETELVSEDMLDENGVSTHFFDVFNLEVLIAYEINKSDDISLQKADELKIMDDITSIYGVKCADRLEASDIYTTNADGFVWFKENVKTEIEETTISVLATTSTTVFTPKQTNVSALIYDELSSTEKANINSNTDSNYPNATRLYTATNRFNCHSYAWYSQNTSGNIYWIENPSAFWTDGSYVSASAAAGRKVRYLSGQHSPSYGPATYNYGAGVTYYKISS